MSDSETTLQQKSQQQSIITPGLSQSGKHEDSEGMRLGEKARALLGARNFGGVYVWLFIILVFSVVQPDIFPTMNTVRAVANTYAISGIIALAATIPLLSGVFDISVGYTMGLAGTLSAFILANTDLPWWIAAAAGILSGTVVGLVNAGVVVLGKIQSIIATLATGTIIAAATTAISGNNSIVENVGGAFSENMANRDLGGFNRPFILMIVLMLVLGFFLESTKTGRYLYAIGFDADTARLSGVRVKSLQTLALIISGTLAALAGVLMVARIGASSPGSGPPYLLPAFAGAFLGATMFRNGRFNAWGTVVAALLLGTGEYGILLVGGPVWSPDVFNGVALISAVAFASLSTSKSPAFQRVSNAAGRIFRRSGRSKRQIE